MTVSEKEEREITASRLCGWMVYRPGKSRRVELWEKWHPSGIMHRVHIQHCCKAVLLTRDFACGESSIRSRQLAASILERRIDHVAVRGVYETFAVEFINGLHCPVGKMVWVITKEHMLAWWAWKRDRFDGVDTPIEYRSATRRSA